MTVKTVYTEVAVDVDIDLVDYDTDELIEEIEDRDGGNKWLVVDQVDTDFVAPRVQDAVYELYRDYISGRDFDRKLKEFFEDQLGILVA